MEKLKWNEQLTDLAKANLRHQSWAFFNPNDMLIAVQEIIRSENAYKISQVDELVDKVGTENKDFIDQLVGFGFVTTGYNSEGESVYTLTSEPDRKGCFSGNYIGRIVNEEGISSSEALHVLGHNFLMSARESLAFCEQLKPPGISEGDLKERFVNTWIFNNKLNPFKFQNLIKILVSLDIIHKGEYGYMVKYMPASLFFYCITERYLLEADYVVGAKIEAGDLILYVNRFLPEKEHRSDDFAELGLTKFPYEGWNKYKTWMSIESFQGLLSTGLVRPISMARIITRLANNGDEQAQVAMDEMRECLENEHTFKTDPKNWSEVQREFAR